MRAIVTALIFGGGCDSRGMREDPPDQSLGTSMTGKSMSFKIGVFFGVLLMAFFQAWSVQHAAAEVSCRCPAGLPDEIFRGCMRRCYAAYHCEGDPFEGAIHSIDGRVVANVRECGKRTSRQVPVPVGGIEPSAPAVEWVRAPHWPSFPNFRSRNAARRPQPKTERPLHAARADAHAETNQKQKLDMTTTASLAAGIRARGEADFRIATAQDLCDGKGTAALSCPSGCASSRWNGSFKPGGQGHQGNPDYPASLMRLHNHEIPEIELIRLQCEAKIDNCYHENMGPESTFSSAPCSHGQPTHIERINVEAILELKEATSLDGIAYVMKNYPGTTAADDALQQIKAMCDEQDMTLTCSTDPYKDRCIQKRSVSCKRALTN